MTQNDTAWVPNPRQLALIDRMARPPILTLAAAARELAISENTVRKWHQIPAFRAAVDNARREKDREITESIQRRIAQASDEAFSVLLEILRDERASPYVRLQAVQDVLDRHLGKATQKQEISGRDGGAVETKATVTHEHSFDFDAFRRTFTDVLHGSGGTTPRDDGSQEPVDPA